MGILTATDSSCVVGVLGRCMGCGAHLSLRGHAFSLEHTLCTEQGSEMSQQWKLEAAVSAFPCLQFLKYLQCDAVQGFIFCQLAALQVRC